jgi:UDP-3-O-[3-hydroxymyristoyl] N-acetylglucosamine deacetylase
MQTTLRRDIAFAGIGLHSGRAVRMTLRPAVSEHGIWFKRTDVTERDPLVPASWDAVCDTRLHTVIGNLADVTVSTVEHIMAALAGEGVSNALIEIDGPEVPIMDGSAAEFVAAIRRAGLRHLATPKRAIRILRRIEVRDGAAMAALEPATRLEMSFGIEFPDPVIGRQHRHLAIGPGTFGEELAAARTFCRRAEIDAIRARGLARGGSLRNAIVVDGAQVLNPEGLRFADEFVRHKMLDALGDLALAGAPVIGRYVGLRAGHALTNQLLRRLFDSPGAFEFALPGAPAGTRRVPLEAAGIAG